MEAKFGVAEDLGVCAGDKAGDDGRGGTSNKAGEEDKEKLNSSRKKHCWGRQEKV